MEGGEVTPVNNRLCMPIAKFPAVIIVATFTTEYKLN